jgi:hypothetical protein
LGLADADAVADVAAEHQLGDLLRLLSSAALGRLSIGGSAQGQRQQQPSEETMLHERQGFPSP